MSEKTRSEAGIKTRYAWHLGQIVFILFIIWGYLTLGSAFVQIPKDNQWILAICSPLVRMFYSSFLIAVVRKVAGKEHENKRSVKLLVSHFVSTKHAVFLAIIVGGVATPLTSACIMAIDFAKTLYETFKIIRKCNKNDQNVEGIHSWIFFDQEYITFVCLVISDDVMKLILSERKSIDTLTYLILVIMAFYGPNAEIIGNIKAQIWQFQRPIADIEAYATNVIILLAVDLSSLLINGILLWHFCKINVLKSLVKLQKQLWVLFAFAEAFIQIEVKVEKMLKLKKIIWSCRMTHYFLGRFSFHW